MNQEAGSRQSACSLLLAGFSFILLAVNPTTFAPTQAAASTTATQVETSSVTPSPSGSPLLTSTSSATLEGTASATPTPSSEPTLSPPPPSSTSTQQRPSATPTLTTAPSPSATPPPTSTPARTPYPSGSVLISEVAWAGTIASSHDEWIELYNSTGSNINLSGWTLTDNGDISLALSGTISARGYYLLERTDDSTVSDIQADKIYRGSLRNGGEALWLKDPSGTLIDSANQSAGAWPAGDEPSRASMERRGGSDQPGNWKTFSGVGGNGRDAAGYAIRGTPRRPNSPKLPPSTATPQPTASQTTTPTPSPDSTPPLSRTVRINEVAWSGTIASAGDEWIELYNFGPASVNLDGWLLSDGGDIQISLSGTIDKGGFFLLERSDDNTVSDIPANQLYAGVLKNSGETLSLKEPSGELVDRANAAGGAWPAGNAASRSSMERQGEEGFVAHWGNYKGYGGTGRDALGNPVQGTPGHPNSSLLPTPEPLWIRGKIRINEVLIRPHYDWEGKGGVDPGDEFIELYNLGPGTVFLKGFVLDDVASGGSKPFKIPGHTLKPGSYLVLFHTQTGISLNDSGDSVRLLSPDGRLLDELHYLKTTAYNLSYGRLPDGSGHLTYGLWPTPGEANSLYQELFLPVTGNPPPLCPEGDPPRSYLPRHVRHPAQVRWMKATGYLICP